MNDALIGLPILFIIVTFILLFAIYALKHARDTIRIQAKLIRVLFTNKTELERQLSLSEDERRDELLHKITEVQDALGGKN